ncbi:hypothetical protein KAFR_0B03990 [Kazachstania africana CBS 2517]|uniref:Uncharacterized protein n=1 Tax=Kazachstania africana (strain ATCC 22294 / BCRC 22015 / CBS 2517 / CECT 1963 / NBRC 1671 / NRRL Y-8276) TaxID=1071382 RepID=H2AQP5_KAZAF|nr:hypothetical protein KAFR_0B03990 [Kazachstania africana CBS 2517]CCF56695.1 hypothetical protein KAFR_0B03990 [Kazachstania africana CBS 2517]
MPTEANKPLNTETQPERVTLPEEVFRGRMPYYVNEYAHKKIFLTFFIGTLVGILFAILLSEQILICFIFSCFAVLSFVVSIVFAAIPTNEFTSHAKMKFLSEIIENKPNANIQTWTVITSHINEYLYDNGLWKTPYRFYNNEDCYAFFRSFVILPYIMGNPYQDDNNNNNVDSNTFGIANPPPHLDISQLVDDFEVEAYKKRALNVFKDSVNEYWQSEFPEVIEMV